MYYETPDGDAPPSKPMDALIGLLLKARSAAHLNHWKTKSFAMHIALEELYELLAEFVDQLAEVWMGMSTDELNIDQNQPSGFVVGDPLTFIKQLSVALEEFAKLIPQLPPLVNIYEELQGAVARVKFKLERLA
jgi:hypothetical protein